MARSSLVAPSILAANFGDLKNEIQSVASLGSDWIHIDVMDGSFVPPITFGDNVIKVAKEACNLHLDVHLMVEHPETHMESFAKAGADRFVVHQETCPHLHRTLSAVKKLGMNCGVAINPATPVTTIFDVLDSCELVLIMTVNPGWGGQSFISECVSKIKTLRNEIDSRRLNTLIQVDGGINQETGKQCFDAGADVFVAGSYIFGSQDREAAIKALNSSMNFILTFLALIPFYLIGAFPTGMMLAKSQGIDITKKGSGNVGATNIARVIGKKAGIITLLVDVSKGLIGSLIASLFADSYFVPLAGVILVAGHCFSLPPKLKGGKGVATALGVMLFINYTAALTGIGTFIIAFSIWRIVSLASLAGALIVPPAAVLIGADNQQTLCLFLISLIVLIRHRSNLQRLIEGKESKFR